MSCTFIWNSLYAVITERVELIFRSLKTKKKPSKILNCRSDKYILLTYRESPKVNSRKGRTLPSHLMERNYPFWKWWLFWLCLLDRSCWRWLTSENSTLDDDPICTMCSVTARQCVFTEIIVVPTEAGILSRLFVAVMADSVFNSSLCDMVCPNRFRREMSCALPVRFLTATAKETCFGVFTRPLDTL